MDSLRTYQDVLSLSLSSNSSPRSRSASNTTNTPATSSPSSNSVSAFPTTSSPFISNAFPGPSNSSNTASTTTTPPSTLTNDDIEAVIQMATSARPSPPGGGLGMGPMRDTRTQLFVGNLPYRVRWQDLKDLFRKAGTVLRADVSLGPDNRSRGYGTVLLASAEDAGRAVDMFNGYSWQTRVLEVRPDRLGAGVGSSDGRLSSEYDTSLMGMSPNLSLLNPAALALAVGPTPFAFGVEEPVDYNNSIFSIDGGMMGLRPGSSSSNNSGRNLFVGNLPFHCQWQDLKDLFRQAGTIIRADVALGQDGRSRGFGTVVFATEADAERGVKMFNGYEYNGRALKVHFDKFSQSTQPMAGTAPASPALPHFQSAATTVTSPFMQNQLSASPLLPHQMSSSPMPPSLQQHSQSRSSTSSQKGPPSHIPMPSSALGYPFDFASQPMQLQPQQLQGSGQNSPYEMYPPQLQSQSQMSSLQQQMQIQQMSMGMGMGRPMPQPHPLQQNQSASGSGSGSGSGNGSDVDVLTRSLLNTTISKPTPASSSSSNVNATTTTSSMSIAPSTSPERTHPHHPGPISLPPQSFPVPPPHFSPHGLPSPHPMSPMHHPLHHIPMTPHGLPPITPSMPPFTFLPQPSPHHHHPPSNLNHAVSHPQHAHPSSSSSNNANHSSHSYHHALPSPTMAMPSSPVGMSYSSHVLSTFSPGVTMSPGAFWGRPGGGGTNPFINPAVGAPVHGHGSPGGFFAVGMGMGYPVSPPGVSGEPAGYFDPGYFPPGVGMGASALANEILRDKKEDGEEEERRKKAERERDEVVARAMEREWGSEREREKVWGVGAEQEDDQDQDQDQVFEGDVLTEPGGSGQRRHSGSTSDGRTNWGETSNEGQGGEDVNQVQRTYSMSSSPKRPSDIPLVHRPGSDPVPAYTLATTTAGITATSDSGEATPAHSIPIPGSRRPKPPALSLALGSLESL